MILAATGHRPDKLGGYGAEAVARVDRCALAWLTTLEPSKVISGFALGWDQSVARAAIALSIPLVAALPGPWQASKWPPASQAEWRRLIVAASEVVAATHGAYSSAAMQVRNEWMADRCDALLALWDGSPGGTANCLRYFERAHPEKPVYHAGL